MSSQEHLSEEEMKRLVEEQQNQEPINDPYIESAKKLKESARKDGLGKVDVKKSKGGQVDPDSDLKSDTFLGFQPLYATDLPSQGLFYPADIELQIRPAKVAEIRHFSTLQERDLFDVDDKLNNIVQNCSKIRTKTRMMSWKDLLEEDRIYVILAIRALTFSKGENKLQVKKNCEDCNTENIIEIANDNLQFNNIPEDLMKYYDEFNRVLAIQTKSAGTIWMKPPTIGVMQVITRYIREKERSGENWDKAHVQILPYIHHEWRGFTEKDIFTSEVDFQGWDDTKYTLHYRLAERVKVGVKPDVACTCKGCGAEVTAAINFRGGIKDLFVVSDISGELL
jgi:hypothetical protein